MASSCKLNAARMQAESPRLSAQEGEGGKPFVRSAHERAADPRIRGAIIGLGLSATPDDLATLYLAMLCIQLLHTTEWGELDYLVIDSPPGTGAVPAALATRVPLTGALVVTTPSKLATADVVRGLRMLRRHAVPVLARTVLSNSVAAAHPHAASQGSGRLPSVAGARREHGELRVRWLRQRASPVRARPHRGTPGRAASRAAVLQPAHRARC